MTKIEALKELFKINLDALNYNLDLKLLIEFKGDEFIIVDKNNIILEGVILNYDLDVKSQRRFILDVASKIFKFLKDNKTMEYEKIEVDTFNTFKIVGYNDFMFKKYTVKVENDKLKKLSGEKYAKYFKKLLHKISFNLDWNKIDVLNEIINYYDYLYVNIVIKEKELLVTYMNEDDLQNVLNSINKFFKHGIIILYYSDVDEKEADKAVEYIASLLNKKG